MFRNTKNNLRLITLKTSSIFTAYGRNKKGEFSFWYFSRFCFSQIGFRLFFKYLLQAFSILFGFKFAFLKKIINPNLEHLGIKLFPFNYDVNRPLPELSIIKVEEPIVSIIIAVYNNFEYTYNCLRAIIEHTSSDIKFEIIIINDCSTDNTLSYFSVVPNLKIISNKKNLGFVLSCNKGASIAAGKYLCFLNNDTIVQTGWLQPMIELIEKDPTVGIVGSKLIFGDGDLQEAGGIVWQDGQTYHYGRRGSLKNKKYNYPREVDYCSGACLLISKSDFDLLNGFDEIYTPGYYEDTDLSFSVKYKLHKKVIYQPASIVVHFEGVTSGTNFNAGMRKFQCINALKFKTKWVNELKTHLPNSFMNLNDTIIKYERSK
jgi:GT2 family glycosyltransferase